MEGLTGEIKISEVLYEVEWGMIISETIDTISSTAKRS
jgi:hypothetical protein